MSTINYKCPACGSALAYSGASGKLTCGACGSEYDLEALEAMDLEQEGASVTFEVDAETFTDGNAAGLDAYHCQMCGAELICEETTTATECPYCGSPTILPEHIRGGVKPEQVVPFLISKDQATGMFRSYFQGQKLIPSVFKKSDNTIKELRKLYVPYWLFDCDAYADITYNAEKKHTSREGEWEVTRTEHYLVRRSGTLGFDSIPVDGSKKMDIKLAESLEPYDLTKAVPFQSAVLSGALADHADIAAEECQSRAAERVETSTEQAMRDSVTGYSSVSVRKRFVKSENGKATPVLLPVWMITTEKDEKKGSKIYTFAINGQTGELTCDVPADKGKYWGWLLGIFAVLMAVICGVLAVIDQLASGTALIGGVVALIIAFAVVSSWAGKLKTAAKQEAARNYVRKGSFNLERKMDLYLHTTTERRKIETQKKN